MTNFCHNQVTIQSTQTDINKITEHLKSPKTTMFAETLFDFNSLIPMPKQIHGINRVETDKKKYYYFQSVWKESLPKDKRELLENFGKESPLAFPDIEWLEENSIDDFTIRRLTAEYGSPFWYDWAIKNWGTKWNAYDAKICIGPIPNITELKEGGQLVYTLVTAWSEPRPVIRALIQYLTPPEFDENLKIKWRFADELEHFQGEINKNDRV